MAISSFSKITLRNKLDKGNSSVISNQIPVEYLIIGGGGGAGGSGNIGGYVGGGGGGAGGFANGTTIFLANTNYSLSVGGGGNGGVALPGTNGSIVAVGVVEVLEEVVVQAAKTRIARAVCLVWVA